LKCGNTVKIFQATISGETVEKVPKRILGWDAEKNDLTECATINDLIIMRGHETPENNPLTILKAFSTVSEVILRKVEEDFTYSAIQGIHECQRLPIKRNMKLSFLVCRTK